MKFVTVSLLILLVSCQQAEKPDGSHIQHSFYHWKTSFTDDSTVPAFLAQEKVDHLYIHYFDVVWDKDNYQPLPVAELTDVGHSKDFAGTDYTPVVFISNACFEHIYTDWEEQLPKKINDKVIFITNQIQAAAGKPRMMPLREIQIDCDWTPGTREKYFAFLKAFKALNPGISISATIRLYPFKYRDKMGVPPVDKGLLMCYNLSPIKEVSNTNSIFRLDEFKRYLTAPAYPLPLDVALPVFGWYAWFRHGKFSGILYPDPDESLPIQSSTSLLKQSDNTYKVTVDTVIGTKYVRQGDVIRVEFPDGQELWEAYGLLRKKLPDMNRIAFYHLDKYLVNKYEKIIHKIYSDR